MHGILQQVALPRTDLFQGAPWNPATTPSLSVPTAGRALGLGRCAAYRAAREGRIPVVMTGERTMRVPTVAMLRLLGYDKNVLSAGGGSDEK
ncbi:MAG: hypothetical protein V9E85_00070 [Candidatus Nanopelagicales bacterium]